MPQLTPRPMIFSSSTEVSLFPNILLYCVCNLKIRLIISFLLKRAERAYYGNYMLFCTHILSSW